MSFVLREKNIAALDEKRRRNRHVLVLYRLPARATATTNNSETRTLTSYLSDPSGSVG